MASALAEQAFASVVRDPRDPDADRWLAGARALSANVRDPALEVRIASRESAMAMFCWDLEKARERGEHAHQLCVEHCPEEPWLLCNVRARLGSIWANLGHQARLRQAVMAWLSDARDRNDQYTPSALEGLGYGSMARLMPDDPDDARTALEAAITPWPRAPFTFAHYGYFLGMSFIGLYRGGDAALAWMESEREWLGRAHLLRWSLGHVTYVTFYAYAALAAHPGAPASRRRGLLEAAEARCKRLSRLHWVLARLNTPLLEAQIMALRGEHEPALVRAREACESAERSGTLWQARSVDYLVGLLEGGDGGRERRERSLAFFAEQGWVKPRRLIAILCPVVDALEMRSSG
jgi:hypothetical protein